MGLQFSLNDNQRWVHESAALFRVASYSITLSSSFTTEPLEHYGTAMIYTVITHIAHTPTPQSDKIFMVQGLLLFTELTDGDILVDEGIENELEVCSCR